MKVTYIFLGRPIVVLVRLRGSDPCRLFQIILQSRILLKHLVHVVHVRVSRQGDSSLSKFSVFVCQDLLLVVEVVTDVWVKHVLVLTHLIKVLFVLSLASTWCNCFWENWKLFKCLMRLVYISEDLPRFQNGRDSLILGQLKSGLGNFQLGETSLIVRVISNPMAIGLQSAWHA